MAGKAMLWWLVQLLVGVGLCIDTVLPELGLASQPPPGAQRKRKRADPTLQQALVRDHAGQGPQAVHAVGKTYGLKGCWAQVVMSRQLVRYFMAMRAAFQGLHTVCLALDAARVGTRDTLMAAVLGQKRFSGALESSLVAPAGREIAQK
eukprot:12187597-Alexandrium_andersonii.AAC.1